MRRFLAIAALVALTGAPAHAGISALVKLAAKLGSVGKAGSAGAKSAKLAKAGTALKGAAALGAVGAAERVFVHVADDGARVAMFVASGGDDALKVVGRAGDEASHTAGSLRRMVDDLDAMGDVAPDAGVDLYLDAGALDRLADLPVGANTRLFLANTDGPSWRLHRAADGAAEVAVGPSTRLRVAHTSLDLALRLAQHQLRPDGEAPEVAAECDGDPVRSELEAAAVGQVLVLLVEPGPATERALEAAAEAGVDVVIIEQPGVCAVDPAERTGGLLARAAEAETLADLWALGATEELPRLVERVEELADHVVVSGAGFAALHAVGGEAVPEEVADEPPEYAQAALGALVLFGVIGGRWWLVRRKRATGAALE